MRLEQEETDCKYQTASRVGSQKEEKGRLEGYESWVELG